jgi:hypothetical protein
MKLKLNDFHDALLVGILNELDKNQVNLLIMKNLQSYKVIFKDVKKLKIDNYQLSNIIMDFDLFTPERFKNYIKKYSNEFSEFLEISGTKKNNHYLNNIINNVISNDLKYIELNTSLGCNGKILFKYYDIII